MKDADALVETLVCVAHRWSHWADRVERRLRHRSDKETLEIICEKALKWACDLRRRGSSCKYWEQIAYCLRDVEKTGLIDYSGMPESVLKIVMDKPRGYFVPGEEHTDASRQLSEAQRLVGGEGNFSGNRDSVMMNKPYRFRRPN